MSRIEVIIKLDAWKFKKEIWRNSHAENHFQEMKTDGEFKK